VTAQAAGCGFVEETLHTFSKRADGLGLLATVNTLIREGGVMPAVVELAKYGKTSKVRHECIRALAGFPQRQVYQEFLWAVPGLQGLLTSGMKQPKKIVSEEDNAETALALGAGGHRTLVSVSQPLHVHVLRIACKVVVAARHAPSVLIQAGITTLCVDVIRLSPNTEAIKAALLTLSNLAAKGYRKEVSQAGAMQMLGVRELASHASSDIRHVVRSYQPLQRCFSPCFHPVFPLFSPCFRSISSTRT